jgi:hypothetical protein
MSKMLIDRAVLEQALRALRVARISAVHPDSVSLYAAAITRAEAALEQDEPANEADEDPAYHPSVWSITTPASSDRPEPDHALIAAARAVLDRWHSPAWEWKEQSSTAELMGNLQAALLKYEVKV